VKRLRADARYASVSTLSRTEDELDITDDTKVAEAAALAREANGEFDLIFNAKGALAIGDDRPEKTIKAITPDAMMRQFLVNSVGPALLLKHLHPLLPRQRRSVFASLSARVGSIGDNRLGGVDFLQSRQGCPESDRQDGGARNSPITPRGHRRGATPGHRRDTLSRPFTAGRKTKTTDVAARNLLDVTENLQRAQTGGFFAYDGSTIEW
jgi:NAD(P)-dependent dehydrogenase (short-subunit alcohol dehydrogenase family)